MRWSQALSLTWPSKQFTRYRQQPIDLQVVLLRKPNRIDSVTHQSRWVEGHM